MVGLASFNVRKKLSMLPLESATSWLRWHSIFGIVSVGLFWLHTGNFWPTGGYERVLTALFYLLSLNGAVGYFLQRLYPARLTQTGLEVIYERIPSELAEIREKAEVLMLACTKETGSDTLAKHYLETLDWFFRRTRFFVNHAFGGQKGSYWVRHQCDTVRRYLNDVEAGYLDKLASLAEIKNKIDFHYAAQGLMKGWLLIHIPLAVAVTLLVLWHVMLVHIYVL
jgi:hypothetical protein